MSEAELVAPVVTISAPGRTVLRLVLTEALEVGRAGPGLLLDDPAISRRHLELRPDEMSVIVTDLGSANGTTLDGRALLAPTVLEPGSVIALGDVRIQAISTQSLGADPVPMRDEAATPATSIERVAEEVIRAGQVPTGPGGAVHEGQTRTIVFSDIERSTDLAVGLGDVAWYELLEVHNAILRSCLAKHSGLEVKSQGDGFMLTFASARRAVAFMVDIQQRLAASDEMQTHELRVRVGAHTGEAVEAADGDLFGRAVIIAARIGAAATGGEILVSSLVREIVESWNEVEFGPPRVVPLKGLAGDWTLHPVAWSGPTGGSVESA